MRGDPSSLLDVAEIDEALEDAAGRLDPGGPADRQRHPGSGIVETQLFSCRTSCFRWSIIVNSYGTQ